MMIYDEKNANLKGNSEKTWENGKFLLYYEEKI